MQTLSDKLPAACRAVMQPGTLSTRDIQFSVVIAAFILLSLCLVGSCNNGQTSLRNSAHASTGAQAVLSMSSSEKERYARDLESLVMHQPEAFLKLIGAEVVLILKEPDIERRDMPSIVWQYAADGCVLDLYFRARQDGDANNAPVVHYEIRASDTGEDAGGACLTTIADARKGTEEDAVRLASAD